MTVASSEKVQARLQILDERLARLRAERDRLVARASRAERKRETRAHTSAERTSWLSMPQKLKRNVNAANPNTAAALDVRTRTAMVVLWASPGFLVTPVGLVPAGRGGPDRNVIHITNLHTLARGCTASQRVHADSRRRRLGGTDTALECGRQRRADGKGRPARPHKSDEACPEHGDGP